MHSFLLKVGIVPSRNATFFLAHRTGITFDLDDIDATRDDGDITGTLYDLTLHSMTDYQVRQSLPIDGVQ